MIRIGQEIQCLLYAGFFVKRQRQRQIHQFLSLQEKLMYQIIILGGGGGGGDKNWEVSL